MKTKFTVKRIVLCSITFAMGLMALLTLFLPLFQVHDSTLDSLISVSHLDVTTFESGFTLLDMKGSSAIYKESAVAVGIFSWAQLALAIVTMLISVICLIVPNEKTVHFILSGQMAICIVFITVYMIFGIAYVNSYYEYFCVFKYGTFKFANTQERLGNTYLGNPLYAVRAQTFAYIGFIIGMLLLIVFLICSIVLKDETKKAMAMHKSDNLVPTNDMANALKQYKELLDNGIITQEEFEKKKREILNL
ncbi:MAG: SHOCT domain-containing protein [Clostridia bacterium]|nr:SHOCT domain-containing protein [Clostridia bacterium]